MKVLVIGYGSIGARHARILGEDGHEVTVVSRRAAEMPFARVTSIARGLERAPDYVVVASRTGEHLGNIAALAEAGFGGRVLVEKPLASEPAALGGLPFTSCHVAYNLRFHPLIARMVDALAGSQAVSAMAYAGQYLPTWRPGTEYRTSYSASAADGGGVLRDLSHELDYLGLLFGGWQRVFADGGHLSTLDIDSDDVFALQIAQERCPVVQLQLNYLDRPGRRFCVVNTDAATLSFDMGSGRWSADGVEEQVIVDRDDSYRAMHRDVLSSGKTACTLEEAEATLELIAAAERSAAIGTPQCRA